MSEYTVLYAENYQYTKPEILTKTFDTLEKEFKGYNFVISKFDGKSIKVAGADEETAIRLRYFVFGYILAQKEN